MPDNAFAGRGKVENSRNIFIGMILYYQELGPKIIMTDDDKGEISSLRSAWPESTFLLCQWHLLQVFLTKSHKKWGGFVFVFVFVLIFFIVVVKSLHHFDEMPEKWGVSLQICNALKTLNSKCVSVTQWACQWHGHLLSWKGNECVIFFCFLMWYFQSTWRWLYSNDNHIKKEDRQHLIGELGVGQPPWAGGSRTGGGRWSPCKAARWSEQEILQCTRTGDHTV